MVLDQFDIILENSTHRFYPGQLVRGQVEFACSSAENVLGLHILIDGKASVHWSEEHTRQVYNSYTQEYDTEYYTINYDSDEMYFEHDFWPFGNGQDQVMVIAGQYEYPFEFMLPDDLPSSWEGAYGWVRYGVHAVIKNKWMSDYTCDLYLSVTAKVDLNLVSKAAVGAETSVSKIVGVCCCKSGPIVLSYRIPRIGYVPGEFIPFETSIQNNSDREITQIVLFLYQYSEYFAAGEKKGKYMEINKLERPGMPPKSNDFWNAVIQVPSIPPDNLGGFCKIIHCRYYIQMYVHITGVGKGPDTLIDVKIGTIPLGSSKAVSAHPSEMVLLQPKPTEAAIHPNADNPGSESKKKGKHHKKRKTKSEQNPDEVRSEPKTTENPAEPKKTENQSKSDKKTKNQSKSEPKKMANKAEPTIKLNVNKPNTLKKVN